ncbi:MAG: double-strand break repair protein AddB, partial [Alphaproteobacteria bacterium]
MSGAPSVYSIPAGVPFVDALAAGLLARAGGDPLALARMTVLLPTRRACRALTGAFLRRTEGAATLLPVLRPIGEVDEDELALAAGDFAGLGESADPPPTIPETRRRLFLARLILKGDWALGGRATGRGALTADQAAALAQELARFLDQAQTQRLDLDRLAGLVPEEYADHWRVTLDFLRLIGAHWPRILETEGCLDPAHRRNLLLDAQVAAWGRAPPADPVIAAGSTGSIPATADLLKCVAGLAQGCVVLPGLDRDTDADSWQGLGPTHPQAGLARLLAHLGIDRDAVSDWPAPELDAAAARGHMRFRLVAEALLPPAATAIWRDRPVPEAATAGLLRIDCASAQEEAATIALVLRRALNEPGKTAALITPDRGLARRVAAELRRWDIEIDDSAGTPLARTPPGAFLRLAAACLAEDAAPVPLLALLKHPLAAGGLATILRGPRPGPGFAGLDRALKAVKAAELKAWLTPIAKAAKPFARLLGRPSVALVDILRAHVAFAEALAASDADTGAEGLWSGEAGEAAAEFIADLNDAAGALGQLSGAAYPALLDELLAGRAVRPRFGAHPRLFVWGLLEARLQQADLVVLGGLNEGSW